MRRSGPSFSENWVENLSIEWQGGLGKWQKLVLA